VSVGNLAEPTNPILTTYTNPRLLEFAGGAVIGYFWSREVLGVRPWVSVIGAGLGTWLISLAGGEAGWSPMLGAILIVGGCLNPALPELKSRLLLALGDASYSIYLTHLFTLAALRIVWVRAMPSESLVSAIAFLAVAIAACAGVGCAVYQWVERPLIGKMRVMVRRRADLLVPSPAPQVS